MEVWSTSAGRTTDSDNSSSDAGWYNPRQPIDDHIIETKMWKTFSETKDNWKTFLEWDQSGRVGTGSTCTLWCGNCAAAKSDDSSDSEDNTKKATVENYFCNTHRGLREDKHIGNLYHDAYWNGWIQEHYNTPMEDKHNAFDKKGQLEKWIQNERDNMKTLQEEIDIFQDHKLAQMSDTDDEY